MRSAKRQHFNECFSAVKHNSKKTWAIIKKLTQTRVVNNTIKEVKVDGITINDPKGISNAFNKFYAGVGKMQAATVPPTDADPMAYLRGLPPESMFLHPTNSEEMSKAIKKLAKKTSKGPDGIPCNILLSSIKAIESPILHCINHSFSLGIFPDCLKTALVIPLYKKKDRTDCTNYRPVSLLNSMSKIIEKILYNRIYDFVGDRLCPNQFGFRPNLSTQDLLCYALEAIARNLNSMSNAIQRCKKVRPVRPMFV